MYQNSEVRDFGLRGLQIIISPVFSLEPLTCISLTGGCVKKEGKADSVLRMLVLTISNCLYIWYDDAMQYVR